MHKYIHNVTKVMCALYVRCALSVLQKGCTKVWGAHYTLGARYRSENTVHKMSFKGHFLCAFIYVNAGILKVKAHMLWYVPLALLFKYSALPTEYLCGS